MWVRTQLKIAWNDLAAGAFYSLRPPSLEPQKLACESYFGTSDALAAYSVRSGFDLLIQALRLEPGDEVIFSALNVRGMVRIVRHAGLVPVPVDLDLDYMAPSLEKLEAAITSRSKVFVAAHLFGTRLDLDPLFRLAKSRGVIAVEDCAQAFNGREYPGSAEADLNMFSFGPIKTATALGGALIRVKDPALRNKMQAIQSLYPVQSNRKQLKRVLQFLFLKAATSPLVLGAIYRHYRRRGKDYEDALADRVRDVAPLKTEKNLRFQPSPAMLALLNRRLRKFDIESIRSRTKKGETMRNLIADDAVMPAQGNTHHDYWVFPLLVAEPRKYIDALRDQGFDASDLPRSQHIAAPADRPGLEPQFAARAMRELIVIPCYADMPDSELVRQASIIKQVAKGAGGPG
jgi:perosamine synthetase